ncbi:MAG: NAD-dependent epimerase/dehydratase family protein [Bdellovibrionia bacterium]
MRALVIGGNRFIGKFLVNSLLTSGFTVSTLNRGNHKVNYSGAVQHLKADRNNREELDRVFKDQEFDVVFDLICTDLSMAQKTVEALTGKTTRYVYLSSTFVYPYGQNLSEEQFDPLSYQVPEGSQKLTSTETKKALEAYFAKAPFKTIIARVPFVFGEGDSTQKLKKLIRMMVQKEEIYIPKKDLKFSAVHVEDLTQALVKLALSRFVGSVNIAADSPIVLSQLIKTIESISYRIPKFGEDPKPESVTLFSLKGDWYLDTSRLKGLDVIVKNPSFWLSRMVQKVYEEVEKEVHS